MWRASIVWAEASVNASNRVGWVVDLPLGHDLSVQEVTVRIAITGSSGQLGQALQRAFADEDLLLIDLPHADILNLTSLVSSVCTHRSDVVIHTAALTDPDRCERDPDAAYRLNVLGTRNVAVAAQEAGAACVYISTDFVFDGQKGEPYREYDPPTPLSVYGRTKALGEELVRDLSLRFYVVRIAWLYGDGPRNFAKTVLRLAEQRDTLHMVTDEVGSPTCALDVAQALAKLVVTPAYGVYHLPNSGTCSRYEWAQEVLTLAGHTHVRLVPSASYERPAPVPKCVELRNFAGAEIGIVMRSWREALSAYMQELRARGDKA